MTTYKHSRMNANIQKILILIVAISCILVPAVHAKDKHKDRKMIQKYGIEVVLEKNVEIRFEDGLSVTLKWFSHKRPMVGGPTKATATMILNKDGKSEEFSLSEHGRAGISREEDGLTDAERYDSKSWRNYEFQLKALNYDESIKVIVTKK